VRFSKTIQPFLKPVVAAALSLAIIVTPKAFSAGTGVVEGLVQLNQKGGAHLADDTSPQPKKMPCPDCPVVVLGKDGRTVVAQVSVNAEGKFHVDLAPGEYVLDVKQEGRRRIIVSPRPFTVVAGQTVKVDLEIESAIEPL
jgi:hypothetical protein